MTRAGTVAVVAMFALANSFAAAQQLAIVGGTIQSVSADGDRISVTVGGDASTNEQTFEIASRTRISLDDKPSKLAELKSGMDVSVTYDSATGIATAIRARAGDAAPITGPERRVSGSEADTPAPADLTDAAPESQWTMNLAQMKIPDGRASGRILGREFVLDHAELKNNILTLRQGEGFSSDAEVKVFLFLKEGEEVAGRKFRVEADGGFGVPHIHAAARTQGQDRPSRKSEIFMNKYAMILEFGNPDRGQMPAQIYLCLPDEARSVVAGHFSVEVFDSTHPLATQTLISGKFTVRGSAQDLDFTLGCVGKNQEGKLEFSSGGFRIGSGTSRVTSTTFAPRFSTASWDERTNSGSHQHVNRPPGHYLIYIRGNKQEDSSGAVTYEGYADWEWVELKDSNSKVTVDLVMDPSSEGTVEVSLAVPTSEKSVVYVPLDATGELPLPELVRWMRNTSSAPIEDGKAVIRHLRQGMYLIAVGPWDSRTGSAAASATVQVKPGETVKVELAPNPRD